MLQRMVEKQKLRKYADTQVYPTTSQSVAVLNLASNPA